MGIMSRSGFFTSAHAERRALPAAVLALALVGASCGGDGGGQGTRDPCDGTGTLVDLGTPHRLAGRHAEFTTSGGTVWVMPGDFEAGGLLDAGLAFTMIEVGSAGTPPSYDVQTDTTAGVIASTIVEDGRWEALDLEKGRYWLWSSRGATITVQQCDDGLSDPTPAVP